MKKQVLVLLSVLALTSLSACGTHTSSSSIPASEPTSSSEAPVSSSDTSVPSSEVSSSSQVSSSSEVSSSSQASSSQASSSQASSSSSSSSSQPDPITTDIVIPPTKYENTIVEEAPYSDNLLLNHRVISVVADNGENTAFSVQNLKAYEQALQSGANLSFVSANPEIATVDANGNVKGIKGGKTTIEVTDQAHPEIKKTVPVNVYDSLKPEQVDPETGEALPEQPENQQDEIDTIIETLRAVDQTNLTEVVDHELYVRSLYKNGKRHLYSIWDQNLVGSFDEAYFRIYETDGDSKTDDAALSFQDYEWIFNTNEFYDTYVYHTQGGIKNYFPISTVNYMDQERTAPMLDIIDNIFTSGRDIFYNMFNNVKFRELNSQSGKMEDGLMLDCASKNYSNVIKNAIGGFYDQDNQIDPDSFYFNCSMDFDETADQDDETRYGIPFGTPMKALQDLCFTVKDGQMVGYTVRVVTTYTIGEDEYQEVIDIDHLYEVIDDTNRDSYIVIPDLEEYTLVDTLFDI